MTESAIQGSTSGVWKTRGHRARTRRGRILRPICWGNGGVAPVRSPPCGSVKTMEMGTIGQRVGGTRSVRRETRSRFECLSVAFLLLLAAGNCGAESAGGLHEIALFPSASSPHWEGFARIVNHSDEQGTVRVRGIDDSGSAFGPIELPLGPRAAAHFNSEDLEAGNLAKRLPQGLGNGKGDWRLHLETDLHIEPLSYIRTQDGFVTPMFEVVPRENESHYVRFFNPASNASQISRLRLVNPTAESVAVTIEGRDDSGNVAPGEP